MGYILQGPVLPCRFSGQPALPGAVQPIPVHTIAVADEVLLIPDNAAYKYDDLLSRYVFPGKNGRKKITLCGRNFLIGARPLESQLRTCIN